MATRELAGDYPRQRVSGHAAAFEQALGKLVGAMKDSLPVNRPTSPHASPPDAAAGWEDPAGTVAQDGRLRGLAPWLRLSPLLEPPSPWGREPGVVDA